MPSAMRWCRLFGKRSLPPLTIVPVIAAGPSLKNLFLWTLIPVLLNVFLIGHRCQRIIWLFR